ncbi:OsmC family protein [Photobacterium sp. SDRW27]|uniref:OsmC family protein n=1 Tax=Photobacterium obscurum TaxID=2829490 RepID=UPI0022444D14|nr:OsmC family protein [Photobacterium obscurum]MCW8330142.1 OsmC family protein [Photobacterium obscurum]
MSEHFATVRWKRKEGEGFNDNKYSREHLWEFDGGIVVPASPSPLVVPAPLSVEENVDPEEAFIASLSSCHMLTFLAIAAKRRYIIESYIDSAVGTLAKNENGKMAITEVVLRPNIVFSGERLPSNEQLRKMHHLSHENCFIANSVNTRVITEIVA